MALRPLPLAAAALAVASGVAAGARAAEACNGAAEFCGLRLDQYTFPGTHNSGSYSLSTPPSVPLGFLTDCYYHNHDLTILGQLQLGIRLFSLEVCERDGERYTCHSSGAPDGDAFGQRLADIVTAIHDWLRQNPGELVAVTFDNVRLESERNETALFLQSVRGIFGDCVPADDEVDVQPGVVRCVAALPAAPSSEALETLTLRRMIDAGKRLVYIPSGGGALMRTYNSQAAQGGLEGVTAHVEKLIGQHAVRKDAFFEATNRSGVDFTWGWWEFDLFTTQTAPSLAAGLKEHSLPCNKQLAAEVDAHFFAADEADHAFGPPGGDGAACGGPCGCAGYRSQAEVLHQLLLDRGQHLHSALADYPSSSFVATIRRMNLANLRRVGGQREPARPLHQCAVFLIVVLVISSLLMASCCAACILGLVFGSWEARCRQFLGLEASRKRPHAKREVKRPEWARGEEEPTPHGPPPWAFAETHAAAAHQHGHFPVGMTETGPEFRLEHSIKVEVPRAAPHVPHDRE